MAGRGRLHGAWLAGFVALLLVAVPGCGGTEETSPRQAAGDEAEARAAVNRFYDAIKRGDAAAVCQMFADEARAEAVALLANGEAGESCPKAISSFIEGARRAGLSSDTPIEIAGLKTQGETVVAKVSVGGAPQIELPLGRRDGEWKIVSSG